jgi:hypothetical protein
VAAYVPRVIQSLDFGPDMLCGDISETEIGSARETLSGVIKFAKDLEAMNGTTFLFFFFFF